MRLLICEDAVIQGETLAALLSARGHPCDWAANVESALARMAVHPYDAVITDVFMPRIDGVEFLRLVRSREAWRAVPVVLLTAASAADLDEIARELPALAPAAVVRKPCTVEEVLGALGALMPPAPPPAGGGTA